MTPVKGKRRFVPEGRRQDISSPRTGDIRRRSDRDGRRRNLAAGQGRRRARSDRIRAARCRRHARSGAHGRADLGRGARTICVSTGRTARKMRATRRSPTPRIRRRPRNGAEPRRREFRWKRATPSASTTRRSESYTLYSGNQGSGGLRAEHRAEFLACRPEKVRVITPDVGGGFGMKAGLYPEQRCVLIAAKIGRPVRWSSDRTEAFLADHHGRDMRTRAEGALDKDGKILALRFTGTANLGGYLSGFAPFIPDARRVAHFRRRLSRADVLYATSRAISPTPRRSTPIAARAVRKPRI